MPTSLVFDGYRTFRPGAYSRVDASALQAAGGAAVGVVAILGTCVGGEPLTVARENDITTPEQARSQYRSGDLRTASLFCFDPSLDQAIPNGASKIVPIKVNPATQSAYTLLDDNGTAAAVVTSRDYGLHTEQINIDIDAGTNQGKLLTVTFEDTVETFDDVGGDPLLSVEYTPGATGWSTITAGFDANSFDILASRAWTGLIGERTADTGGTVAVEVLSSDAGDTSQAVTVYGILATVPVSATFALNGTSVISNAQTFDSVSAVIVSAAHAGTVTVRIAGAGATLFSLTTGTLTRGIVTPTNLVLTSGTIDLDAASAGNYLVIRGLTSAGTPVAQYMDVSAGTPVTIGATFRQITQIELGDLSGSRTATVAATVLSLSYSSYSTIQKIVDRVNAFHSSLEAIALVASPSTFLAEDADRATAASILSTAAEFTADLYYVIAELNDNSVIVSAERSAAPNGLLVPANVGDPVYLTGGSEGSTTLAEWQEAFRLLKGRDVNDIIVLSRDPAVHSLLRSHLRLRAGKLRMEAAGYVGLAQSDGTGETLSNIRTLITQLNTRHIGAVVQEFQQFDPDSGEATWYPPYMLSAIAAGMQAGSPVGEPLTHKLMNVLDIRNDSSWSVEDDIETLIESGAMVAEKVDGKGIRWVRSVSTYIQDANPVFSEMSANESLDVATRKLRDRIEIKIGSRGLSPTPTVIKGLATQALDDMVTDQEIVAYKPETLRVEMIGDTFPVSVELAPILPVNFCPIVVHAVALRAAA